MTRVVLSMACNLETVFNKLFPVHTSTRVMEGKCPKEIWEFQTNKTKILVCVLDEVHKLTSMH